MQSYCTDRLTACPERNSGGSNVTSLNDFRWALNSGTLTGEKIENSWQRTTLQMVCVLLDIVHRLTKAFLTSDLSCGFTVRGCTCFHTHSWEKYGLHFADFHITHTWCCLLVISLFIPELHFAEFYNKTMQTKEKEDKEKRKLTRSNSEKRYHSISLIISPHNIYYFFCMSLYIQTSILKARLFSVRSLLSCLLMNVCRVITLRDNLRLPLPFYTYSFMVLAWTIQSKPTTRDRVSTGCGQTVVVR